MLGERDKLQSAGSVPTVIKFPASNAAERWVSDTGTRRKSVISENDLTQFVGSAWSASTAAKRAPGNFMP
jgi:hypothetical protein